MKRLMKSINNEELFAQISQFLKSKGIELQEGSYTHTIRKGCQVLADTINLGQQAVGRAKSGVEEKLEKVRQVLHQKTAPRQPPVQPQAPPVQPEPIKPRRPRAAGSARKTRAGKRPARPGKRPS